MKAPLLATAALALAAYAAPAEAARFSAVNGNRLMQICTSRDAHLSNSCTAYIEGVSDSISLFKEIGAQRGGSAGGPADAVCVPAEVTGNNMRTTVVNWLRQHPDAMNRPASGVVADALREAYGCR